MNFYCVFNIGDQRVGINMANVREIIEQGAIEPVPVPLAPDFFHGLFNLRGQVLPLLDLGPFVGAGSSLVSKEALAKNDWAAITTNAKAFVEPIRTARAK